MGDFEVMSSDIMESSLRYHPGYFEKLTEFRQPETGKSLVGSLTGAVASKRVTEALKGSLKTVGNRL